MYYTPLTQLTASSHWRGIIALDARRKRIQSEKVLNEIKMQIKENSLKQFNAHATDSVELNLS